MPAAIKNQWLKNFIEQHKNPHRYSDAGEIVQWTGFAGQPTSSSAAPINSDQPAPLNANDEPRLLGSGPWSAPPRPGSN